MTRSTTKPLAVALASVLLLAACGEDAPNPPATGSSADAGDTSDTGAVQGPDASAGTDAATEADTATEPDTDAQTELAVSIAFALRDDGDRDLGCDDTLSLGTEATDVTLSDARFYVHAVELFDGTVWVPVTLEQDETWQLDDIALLDFEDGTGACANGNALLRNTVVGTVPAGTYDGLRFAVGVPFERNHDDVATAPAPLSYSAMFWNWQGGYKFIRLEGTNAGDGLRLHLGSTGCEGTTGAITSCARPNRPTVVFDAFDPSADTVVLDASALFAAADVSANTPETPPGCMSAPDDPDCPAVLDALGLDADGAAMDGQVAFRVAR